VNKGSIRPSTYSLYTLRLVWGALQTYAWVIGLTDAVVCATLAGFVWHRKGGDAADGIGLGGILGIVGLVFALVLTPKRSHRADAAAQEEHI
jgi:hypothetical protein